MEKEIRKLAIMILDDSNGISTDAFVLLEDILKKTGGKDIVNEVIYEAGRVFLGEDTAAEILRNLETETETETEVEDLECKISPSDIMEDVRSS